MAVGRKFITLHNSELTQSISNYYYHAFIIVCTENTSMYNSIRINVLQWSVHTHTHTHTHSNTFCYSPFLDVYNIYSVSYTHLDVYKRQV